MNSKRNAKGEGSFKINPEGTVTHRKSVGFKPNGQRKIITVTAKTKSACIKAMREKEAEWNRIRNRTLLSDTDTVVDLCYKHLNYQVANGDLKGKSIDRRECTIENQLRWYDMGMYQIHMITPGIVKTHIRELIAEGKVGSSSIIKVLDVLNAAFQWAVGQGDVDSNPVEAVKPELMKRIKKMSAKGANEADVTVLSDEEVKQFEWEVRARYKNGKEKYPGGLYYLLLLYTGMRVGEMIALRWRDWQGEYLVIEKSISVTKNRDKKSDSEANYISQEGTTKNQKARVIQLSQQAKKVLRELQERSADDNPDMLIAPTKSGKVNTATNLEHGMKTIMRNAGLDDVHGGLHTFRKTFATQMYESGARVEEIAAYIGDLASTTQKYYIAIRKKVVDGDGVRQVVKLPQKKEEERPVA